MTYNTIESIREFLNEKPGYQKKGVKWLSEHLNTKESLVSEAMGVIRANKDDYTGYDQKENHQNDNSNRLNKTNNITFTAEKDQTLQEYCESVGLDYNSIDPLNDVKYWTDAAGRRRYTVVPKNLQEKTEKFKEDLIEAIKQATPKVKLTPKKNFKSSESFIGLINLYDAHLDKLCEISDGHTIEDNINLVRNAIQYLLGSMSIYSPNQIILPIGSDFFNSNDFNITTKRGTQMQDSVHWKKGFQAGVKLIRELIQSCLDISSKVFIIPIEGNHDEDKVFYLNEVLKAAYEDVSELIIYDESRPRHYIHYGVNLLGFGHGYVEKKNTQKLPLFMAEESPEAWGKTKYRKFFLGDIHHKEEYRFLRTKDYKGCTVQFLRDISLSNSEWDRLHGYHTEPKTVQGNIFHHEHGEVATFNFNV